MVLPHWPCFHSARRAMHHDVSNLALLSIDKQMDDMTLRLSMYVIYICDAVNSRITLNVFRTLRGAANGETTGLSEEWRRRH